jgi:molybdenum cofactor cytidylyltransferase
MNCAALVLAAGASRRWDGGPKALFPWEGRSLVDHACATAQAAGCAPVYRVLGAHRAAIEAEPAPAGVVTVFNPAWADGLGSSIACGIRELEQDPAAAGCAGVALLLCDQPLVTPALLRALWAEYARDDRGGIILADHGDGTRGPPAFFARAFWSELATLAGDEGARRLARAHPDAVATVPATEARWDLDTPADYEALRQARAGRDRP